MNANRIANSPREQLIRDYRFMQMQLVGLMRDAATWRDRMSIADAISVNGLDYRSMLKEMEMFDAQGGEARRAETA